MLNLTVKMTDLIPKDIIDDYLTPALNNSNHLLTLINDILDFT